MTNYNTITFVTRIVRALLKDRLQNNNNAPAIWTYTGDITFTLPDDYISAPTIVVKKNGVTIVSGWSFNSATNEVTITASLVTGNTITITYSFYDKYSDNEILDYIESSLAYFNQFGYRKTFVLNGDRDEVIAVDDVIPTIKECYQIAIIAAIVIDPKNIEIRTKEFSVSAEEKKSKSELITEAFQQFTNFVGELTFDEILRSDLSK